MKKIFSLILAIMLLSTCAYAQQQTVTMYAPDGRTIEVFDYEVSAYKNVGWYENYIDVITILYAADGRTAAVYKADTDKYTSLGWYTSNVVTMYAPDGRTTECPISEIQSYKSVGWYESPSDILVNMYSADGRVIKVYRSEVPAYEGVGWYEKSLAYYQSKPFFTEYGDLCVSDMQMGMTYAQFLSIHSADITNVSEPYYSEYHEQYCFDVNFANASLGFISTDENVNDIYAYTLFFFSSESADYMFPRGLSIGKSVSFIKERVPACISSSSHTGYAFDEQLQPTDAYYNSDYPIYAMNEEYGFISFFHGYTFYPCELLKIYFENGAISKLELFGL